MKNVSKALSYGVALSLLLLLACEEHARRTWMERAVESQSNLLQVQQFLALERAHVKKLCSLGDLMDAMMADRLAKEGK